MYTIQAICQVIQGRFAQQSADSSIDYLVYDSRNISFADSSLFFALKTAHNDGHLYIADVYKKGIRNFIISQQVDLDAYPDSNFIVVPDTLVALQQLALFHRSHFHIPVIGITGSNGKTIVKEWLYQLLEPDYHIVRSPKSYNSQIGVPLSVWQMNHQHTIAIFEAGISTVGEMQHLAPIIAPTIGIFTNLGEAHSEGFASQQQKLTEKLQLFATATLVIGEYEILHNSEVTTKAFTWGRSDKATVQVTAIVKKTLKTDIELSYQSMPVVFTIPFTDDASIENAITCCCTLLYLGYSHEALKEGFLKLHPVDMRLQLKSAINGCVVINDSYSADITSLHTALNFLQQQQTGKMRSVILSDFFESGKSDEELYRHIAAALVQHHVQKAILIGSKITTFLPLYLPASVGVSLFNSTEDFIQNFKSSLYKEETILIKGARKFEFERIARLFEIKVHQTVLEINLNAIVHNLKQYQKRLQPGVKVMAMVKAFAYGSGGAEIASVLQYHNIDYLGVAYADEGIELRKAGITLPVMVMNADETTFDALITYNLQPVIYSFDILRSFEQYVQSQGLQSYPVHIEIETGMNRLGFNTDHIEKLGTHIGLSAYLKAESVFSHLAASDNPAQDDFTSQQADKFLRAVHQLTQYIPYTFLKHIANSAAIIRHRQLQLDMVRLGIGLYGIEADDLDELELQPVATLRSNIAQLKHLKKGETVSYNRNGVVQKDAVIATIRIGYADGYSRRFSNGIGKMWIAGKLAPVIGSVCMDMTMIDVTEVPNVKQGDAVIIFGAPLPVQEVAGWIGTIPYEIMTGVSQRVKRIYFQE